jgi:hypothetical protein
MVGIFYTCKLGSSVNIVIVLGDRLWENRDSIPVLGRGSSILHNVQTDSGADPAAPTTGTGGSFLRGKAAGL